MATRIMIRPYKCVLDVTRSRKEYAKLHAKYCDEVLDLTGTDGISSTLDNSTYYLVGIFNKKDPLPVLAHELAHVCFNVFNLVGIPIGKATSEAYCYLLEDLLRQATPTFKKR